MEEIIKNFPSQFAYKPVVANQERLKPNASFIVCGMGGSHLAAGLFKIYRPRLELLVHRDYGLPRVPDYFLRESLLICSSYSGRTEEVLDVCEQALRAGLNIAVMSSGGRLLALAQEKSLPHVALPSGYEPRLALGFMSLGLAKLIGDEEAETELRRLAQELKPTELQAAGEAFSAELNGCVPIIYASTVNLPLAYTWKIKFNETAKTPAFCNALSEANHNELAGWERTAVSGWTPYFIFLRDETDHPRIQKRFAVLSQLLKNKSWLVKEITLTGVGWSKIFSSLVLADWTTFALAQKRGVDPLAAPAIEEFKKLIA